MRPLNLLDHFAVAVSAKGKALDLFGVLELPLVTALVGKSLRDMLAGDAAPAWLRMPELFTSADALPSVESTDTV